jgi:ribosomal protein L7/L12
MSGTVVIEIHDCARRANTVAAIKYVRQRRELGMAEAKHLIDEIYYGGRSITLEFASETEAGEFVNDMELLGFSCRKC